MLQTLLHRRVIILLQTLRRKERDYEHEMERLAREKIAAQQRLFALKKELAATWDHIDFNTLLPEQSSGADITATRSGMFYNHLFFFILFTCVLFIRVKLFEYK